MAVLGARLLEGQRRVGETAQAIELRQSGENSVLSNVAMSASASLTQVLRWAYWWNSTEETGHFLILSSSPLSCLRLHLMYQYQEPTRFRFQPGQSDLRIAAAGRAA